MSRHDPLPSVTFSPLDVVKGVLAAIGAILLFLAAIIAGLIDKK